MAITFDQHRTRIGRFILFSSFGLIFLIFLLWFLSGFDDAEFQELLKMIAPIKAVYLSALIKYIIAHPHTNEKSKEGEEKKKPLNRMYLTTSWLIISTHMISLIILVFLSAFFKSPSHENLLLIISAIETFFGVYVGLFLTNLFEAKKETT